MRNPFIIFAAFALAVALTAPSTAAWAQEKVPEDSAPPPDTAQNFTAGLDYLAVEPPQSVRVQQGKLELIEFFNFSCPHCYRLQKPFERWFERTDTADIVLVRQPVVFQRTRGHYARAYFTLEAMGIVDEFYGKVFFAIHEEKLLLNSEGRFLDWLEEQNADAKLAESIYNSFAVNTKVSRAAAVAAAYNVDSTPQLALDGAYILTPTLSRTRARLFDTLDFLIARRQTGE